LSVTTEPAPPAGGRRGPSPMMLVSLGIGAVVAIALIVVVSILTGGSPSDQGSTRNSLVGHRVAAFHVPGLLGGTVSAPWARGEPGVVIFFASWCGPCQREMPEVARYLRAHPPVGATVVGIDALDQSAAAKAFVARDRVPFAVGVDATGDLTTGEFGFRTVPETVFVNAKGVVTDVYLGAIPRVDLVKGLVALGATP
jgi:cytochrome c biogenesis protein CcmG/thiol:disulfide interchange protein DsbE